MEQGRQAKNAMTPRVGPAKGWELVVPNPKFKLIDQVREVLRVKHYAIRTEQWKVTQSHAGEKVEGRMQKGEPFAVRLFAISKYGHPEATPRPRRVGAGGYPPAPP